MHPFIETQKEWMKTDIAPFRPGDTVRVNVRVKEGDKERVQAFEGVCIARRGGGVSETFTVRKISNGVGVERIFPLHSPMVADIVVVRRGVVRRAKLYYLRDVTGKAARIKERKVIRAPKRAVIVVATTVSWLAGVRSSASRAKRTDRSSRESMKSDGALLRAPLSLVRSSCRPACARSPA